MLLCIFTLFSLWDIHKTHLNIHNVQCSMQWFLGSSKSPQPRNLSDWFHICLVLSHRFIMHLCLISFFHIYFSLQGGKGHVQCFHFIDGQADLREVKYVLSHTATQMKCCCWWWWLHITSRVILVDTLMFLWILLISELQFPWERVWNILLCFRLATSWYVGSSLSPPPDMTVITPEGGSAKDASQNLMVTVWNSNSDADFSRKTTSTAWTIAHKERRLEKGSREQATQQETVMTQNTCIWCFWSSLLEFTLTGLSLSLCSEFCTLLIADI